MKKIIFIITIVIFNAEVYGQNYTLAPELSTAKWVGYGEIGSFLQEGNIDLKNGNLQVDDGMISSGLIVFDSKSINHSDKKLRKHLRANDFFDSRNYPEIKFEIISTYGNKVLGKLHIKKMINEEELTFRKITKEGFMVIEGQATIDRTKYDIKYNSSSYFQDLGNYAIKNEFDLKFKLVFKAP